MSYQIELIDRPAQPVLSRRTRSSVQDLPQALGQTYGAIAQHLGQLGEAPAGPPFTAYYNMDMQDLDVEIGFPVSRRLPGTGDIQPGEIPGGRAVTCLHVGPYHQVSAAYQALDEWMKAHGHEPSGAPYEMYLNDPAQTAPEALETRVTFPIRS
jgi:effector-binding domain-containing protein